MPRVHELGERMSGGLFALLDDIAALARLAAASVDDVGAAAGRASVKAAGVVVDDTAVTPQYVHGITAEREFPIVRRIAVGSLRNKLLFILPAALLLSQFIPWALTPLLMVGGTYLCYEGAEKIWGALRGHHDHDSPAALEGADAEEKVVSGAIRTDFILSTEIMVIALNEVAGEPLFSRAVILVVVAIGITLLVYGVVAAIVKMDDAGLALAERPSRAAVKLGRGLVHAMPGLLSVISASSASPRCCGSAATSCWSGSTTWAGTGSTTWSTTQRRPCTTPPVPSAAPSPGWSTPRPRH